MRRRPPIKPGDLVKLSKKGRAKYQMLNKNAVMKAYKVFGDGIDYSSCIFVDCNGSLYVFPRPELWKIGESKSTKHPLNNSGREYCYWCEQPTQMVQLLFSADQVCVNKECRWYKN